MSGQKKKRKEKEKQTGTLLSVTGQQGDGVEGVQSSTLCYSTSHTWKENRDKVRLNLQEKILRGINNILQEIKEELERETVNEKHTDIINLLNLFSNTSLLWLGCF